MWTRSVFGTDVYHIVAAFFVYSVLGWVLESIYMSFCEKKPTNRGFAKGPFCPIYGVGATVGYQCLVPLKDNWIFLYFAAAVIATLFEYIVGRLMIRFLGELWWDYNMKPFNYQGIICLESTIAWGFYGLGVVYYVRDGLYGLIDRIDMRTGTILIAIAFVIAMIDYIIQLSKVFNVDLKEKSRQVVKTCQGFISRRD